MMSLTIENTHEPLVWSDQRFARMEGFDPDAINQEAFAEKHYIVIGGGTVGYRVLEALMRSGAGLNGGKVTIFQGNDLVEEVNLHSAFTVGDLGKPKVDGLRRLVNEIDPNANVEIIPAYMEDPNQVFAIKPDVIISAFDDALGMAMLHGVARLKAQRQEPTAPIILGTDLGRGGVLVERFNYPQGAALFNGHVDLANYRTVIGSRSKTKEELTPGDMMARTRLIFEVVGLQHLPSDMLRSLLVMREKAARGEKTSFSQHPFSGLVVGAAVVNYIYNMVNGIEVKDISEVDSRMQFYSEAAVQREFEERRRLVPMVLQAFGVTV